LIQSWLSLSRRAENEIELLFSFCEFSRFTSAISSLAGLYSESKANQTKAENIFTFLAAAAREEDE
jgi:hypothetical protein